MEQNSPVETFQSVREDNLFQTNRSFRKSSGWAVEICLFHLLSVWNHRNFHVNGKQPYKQQIPMNSDPVTFCLDSWKRGSQAEQAHMT
jgi:hypothetical protein